MRNKILKSAYSIMNSVTVAKLQCPISCLLSIYDESTYFINRDDDQDFLVLCKCSKTEKQDLTSSTPRMVPQLTARHSESADLD